MAEPVTLPIDGGFYESESLPVSAQQCINQYVSIPQTDGLSEAILVGTPGLVQIGTTGELNEVNRGSHTFKDRPYFVNNGRLWRLNQVIDGEGKETFSLEQLGEIEQDGRVSIADNGTQMMILVPGGKGYIFTDDPDSLVEITDPDFTANGQPQYVKFINGYFAVTTDIKKWIVSAPNDGLNWNALDFGSAEYDPDPIVAPVVHKGEIYITGSQTTQRFRAVATSDFPFEASGEVMDKGVFAPNSIVNANNTFMFIGGGENESPAIWLFAGVSFEKISTNAIDSILQSFTDSEIKQAFAYAYAQKGAYFVAFNLPTTTLVIDTITGKWHERKSQVINDLGLTETLRYRVNSITKAYNRLWVGDSQDGRIGYLDPDFYTEYGNEVIRTFVTRPFHDKGRSVFVPRIEATLEAGVGNEAANDPKIRMSWSRDGKTFFDERERPIGKVGEYDRRAIWYRNGRFPRFAVFKFVTSDPVKPIFIKLEAWIRLGTK